MEQATIDGVTFAYELTGQGPETIVFLNGIAMSIAHWKSISDDLSSSCRCLLHDFRGQLLSGKPAGPYSLEQHAEDVAGLMEVLGIDRAHVVGTSYGAEVGMIMGYRHPEKVQSLVLIDGVSETHAVLSAAVQSWKTAALTDPVLYYRSLLPWNYSDAYLDENREALAEREPLIAGLPSDYFTAFGELCDAFLAIDITGKLSAVVAPTLVVCADGDILKPVSYSRIIHREIPGSRLEIIAGAGHAVVIEKPQVVASHIREFLQSCPD